MGVTLDCCMSELDQTSDRIANDRNKNGYRDLDTSEAKQEEEEVDEAEEEDNDDLEILFEHNYEQFFEFQCNHPNIKIGPDGFSASNRSSTGESIIMFGQTIDNDKIYTFDCKINQCGCPDNIGIGFVPNNFDYLNGSHKSPYTYMLFSDGVYYDWNGKSVNTENDFTFNFTATKLRIKIDTLKQQIIITNLSQHSKQHIIKLDKIYCHQQTNDNQQKLRMAFILYSGGDQENSKITVTNQSWWNSM